METNASQLKIDFDKGVYRHMNNEESDTHAKENEQKFSEQCKRIYDYLKSGKRITTMVAMTTLRIGHLQRRIKDLTDIFEIDVQSEWVKGEGKKRYKEYYL